MRAVRGKVISDKMTKTVVVEVVRLKSHPIYHKRIKRTKKYHVHNGVGAKAGDIVEFVPTRPVSATKHWKVTRVVSRDAAA